MPKDDAIELLSKPGDKRNTLMKTAGIFMTGVGLLMYAISLSSGGALVGLPASFVLIGCAFLLYHRIK